LIREHEAQYPVRWLCKVMALYPGGYYDWRCNPESKRSIEDRRLLGYIKQSWLESGAVYGYRKVHDGLCELGEACGHNRDYRLMQQAAIRSQTGYHRRSGHRGGQAAVAAPNWLQQQFDVAEPNRVRVTDITYIRTHEGWLLLAAVIDLFSRPVVGWSMQARMDRELALNALLMAVWRRQSKQTVTAHSDQGSQFSGYDWQDFLKAHNLQASMSRRGNCHDNAAAESFFQILKRERIRRRVCSPREEARQDVFDYIETFYNTKRRHGYNNPLSPRGYEKQYFERLASV
jgi:putative transposase